MPFRLYISGAFDILLGIAIPLGISSEFIHPGSTRSNTFDENSLNETSFGNYTATNTTENAPSGMKLLLSILTLALYSINFLLS